MNDATEQVSFTCESCKLPATKPKLGPGRHRKMCLMPECIQARKKAWSDRENLLKRSTSPYHRRKKNRKGNPCTFKGCLDTTGVNRYFCPRHHKIVSGVVDDIEAYVQHA